jgi:hypothetical protein
LGGNPARPDEIETRGTATIKLPALYVEDLLKQWKEVGLVEQPAGQTGYWLRSLSLAQLLAQLPTP